MSETQAPENPVTIEGRIEAAECDIRSLYARTAKINEHISELRRELSSSPNRRLTELREETERRLFLSADSVTHEQILELALIFANAGGDLSEPDPRPRYGALEECPDARHFLDLALLAVEHAIVPRVRLMRAAALVEIANFRAKTRELIVRAIMDFEPLPAHTRER